MPRTPTQIEPAKLFAALSAAARDKGRPLSDGEKAAVNREVLCQALRARFLNVIRLAGYREGAPEAICNEWLPKYMADIPAFETMLTSYELADGDPD